MFVVITEEQVLIAQQVCQNCLLADHSGLPRWREGKFGCAHSLSKSDQSHPTIYQCQMGFRIANIE
ncbi:hypothetical protein [Gloeocapsa sp. PCC 73106]|uniref:hypothetical protein n=1 Tax=Gloeocapsa sp. PCC 73106 TaxID=102232 RepID=UPI0002ABC885|nr:hypothetical protein [Gloeocapsa sp. PCC 73106]ELR98380.1 hypothetical protein GLO73106DRAFT_00022110 [Gloeocapsa sp. PCC 73106]